MRTHLPTLLVAAVLTIAIALISGGGWAHYLVGALFALTLWFMLFMSSFGQEGVALRAVGWTSYALGSVITLVLGSVFLWVGGRDNPAWWGPAVIMAASLMWPVRRAVDGERSAG